MRDRLLSGVSINVEAGQFVAIVGPNGAGKTTLFKTISGIRAPQCRHASRSKATTFCAVAPAERPHLGIAHVPEGRQVFPSLTVMENLEMGAMTEAGRARLEAQYRTHLRAGFPCLPNAAPVCRHALGGEQQMLAIGRGLASSPKLLMLDEPSMGLAPAIADLIFDRLIEIRRQTQLTILLVEQRVAEALESADHGYVLEAGRVALEGDKQTLRADDRVQTSLSRHVTNKSTNENLGGQGHEQGQEQVQGDSGNRHTADGAFGRSRHRPVRLWCGRRSRRPRSKSDSWCRFPACTHGPAP